MANTDPSVIDRIIELFTQLEQPLSHIVHASAALASLDQIQNPINASIAAVNRFAGVVGMGGVTGTMLQVAEQQRQTMNQWTQMGVGNLDVTGMIAKQVATGLTPEQLQEIWRRNLPMMSSGMAGSPDAFMNRTFEIHQKMKETALAKEGTEITTEMNATMFEMAMSMASLGSSINLSEEQIKKFTNQAVAASMGLDETARITGRSRDAIAQETQERLNETRSRMFLAHATDEQKEAYSRLIEMTNELGPDIQDLVLASARGARLTDEQLETLASLNIGGPSGTMLEQATRAMMQAGADPRQRAQAEEMLKQASAEVAKTMSSKDVERIAATAAGPIADRYVRLYEQNMARGHIEAQLKEMRKTRPEATWAEARAELGRQTQEKQAGRTITGEIDPRQIATREFNAFLSAGATNLAGLMKEFDTAAVNNVHLFAEGIRLISERAFGGNKSFEEKAKEFGLIPGEIKQGIQYVTGMPALQPSPGVMFGPNQPMTSPTGGTTAPPGGSWFDSLTNLFFNQGTHGVFGEWFNDFGAQGTLAKLHNNEAVVPFNDLSKFLSDTYESMPHLFQSIIADVGLNKPTISKPELPFEFSKIATTFEKIQQEQQKAFNTFQGITKPSPSNFINSDDVAVKSLSTPRTKTVIKEPFNATDAMSMSLTGKMPQARTDEEDQLYKEWIIGGQIGPDPVEERRKTQEIMRKNWKEGRVDSISKLAKKSSTKPKEGKLASPELQKILEEGISGQTYEITGESAEEMFKSMQSQMGEIKTPEPSQLPSMSDLAGKMQEGMPKVEQGLSAAAKMVPEMAGMSAPGSLSDVVNMLGKLHGTMTGMAATAKSSERHNRAAADRLGGISGSLLS